MPMLAQTTPTAFLSVAIAAALVVLIGGALAWKMAGRTETIEPSPQKIVNTPTPHALKGELAKVTLITKPDGAEVTEGGVMIGNTPLTIDWPRGTTREFTFKLADHKDLVRTLRSEADQSFDFHLETASSPKPPPSKKPPLKKGADIGAFD